VLVKHLDLTVVERCLAVDLRDRSVPVLVQVPLFQAVECHSQEVQTTPRFSLCSLEALSKQTHQSTSSGLAVGVEHIVRQSLAFGRGWEADSAVVACHLLSSPETVGLVLVDHLADHWDHRNSCSLLGVWELEEHHQASHERCLHIVRANQAVSGFVMLGAGNCVGEPECLMHGLLGSVHALVHFELWATNDGLLNPLCDECCSSRAMHQSWACRCWTPYSSAHCSRRNNHRRNGRFHRVGVPGDMEPAAVVVAPSVALRVPVEIVLVARSAGLPQQSMAWEVYTSVMTHRSIRG
jgi:hypothetical protein